MIGIFDQKNTREALRIIVKQYVPRTKWILVWAYDEAVFLKHTGPESVELNRIKTRKTI